MVFFFKQKTAYEVRISDWSSDVCSSDLLGLDQLREERRADRQGVVVEVVFRVVQAPVLARRTAAEPHEGARAPGEHDREILAAHALVRRPVDPVGRSEERRVGKEWVSTCSSRWSPVHSKNNTLTVNITTTKDAVVL